MDRIIGIPSTGSELFDNISPHFGHCEYFIGVKISENNEFEKIFTLHNDGHSGCMEPVLNMKRRYVTDMILTGIGMRPFMGFQQVNIKIYQGIAGSIEKNIEMLIKGQLKSLDDSSCGNHSGNAHTH